MTLALIAGRGGLPAAVAGAQSTMPLIFALDGFMPEGLALDGSFRIEHLGSLVGRLKELSVDEVCLCGGIDRPMIDPARIDAATLPLVPVMMQAMAQGDDGALRAVIAIFEQAGLTVRAAHTLAPDLLPPKGVPTRAAPDVAALVENVALAQETLAHMGRADLGQACVLRAGAVIAREDVAGTDAMLERITAKQAPSDQAGDPFTWTTDLVGDALGAAADWLSGIDVPQPADRAGGFLFKAPKPGQDRRADLPTIGPRTAMAAAAAGLDGIVIEAGGVIVLDRAEVIDILDRMQMYLWVRPA
jgi:DUF1009 family protein